MGNLIIGGTAVNSVSTFEELVISFLPVFTEPTGQWFVTLVRGGVQCLGRPMIRRLLSVVEGTVKSPSSYARFFRTACWQWDELWQQLVVNILVPWFCAKGKLLFVVDDTTTDKHGKRVAFAAVFRDAVRSRPGSDVFVRARCWVLMTSAIRAPLCRRRVPVPVMAWLYRKPSDCDAEHPFGTRQELALEMIEKLAKGLPDRKIELVADGAYPCAELVQKLPENVQLTSRIQSNAAVYEEGTPPSRPCRGRPRQKGKRLPSLAELAEGVTRWQTAEVLVYGQIQKLQLWSRTLLWWHVAKGRAVLLVVSRGLGGNDAPQFFFTTNLEATAVEVVEMFGVRFGIEEVIRDAKQLVGFGKVQGWAPRTVQRQAPFALFVLALVKVWYLHELASRHDRDQLSATSAMLTTLRLAYWRRRINRLSLSRTDKRKIIRAIRNALAAAA
jgi:hypothetical protein